MGGTFIMPEEIRIEALYVLANSITCSHNEQTILNIIHKGLDIKTLENQALAEVSNIVQVFLDGILLLKTKK